MVVNQHQHVFFYSRGEHLSEAKERGLNPIALRTFSEYMNKLRDVGLVKVSRARVRGKVTLALDHGTGLDL